MCLQVPRMLMPVHAAKMQVLLLEEHAEMPLQLQL